MFCPMITMYFFIVTFQILIFNLVIHIIQRYHGLGKPNPRERLFILDHNIAQQTTWAHCMLYNLINVIDFEPPCEYGLMHTYLSLHQDCLWKLPKTSQEPWPTMPYENLKVKPHTKRGPHTPLFLNSLHLGSTYCYPNTSKYYNKRGAHLSAPIFLVTYEICTKTLTSSLFLCDNEYTMLKLDSRLSKKCPLLCLHNSY